MSSKTLGNSNATTYNIGSDASNYATAGTYYFNRYAKDAICNTAWVAASGVYALGVRRTTPPGSTPNTLCSGCCYNGSSWVNCYVTIYAYPFNDNSSDVRIQWSGNGNTYYPGAYYSMDGRRNTAAISSTGESAVQACKDLGNGWYLPAYEELANMIGTSCFDNGPSSYYWSSTEYYGNDGRFSTNLTIERDDAVRINLSGTLNDGNKTLIRYVRCAWQE
jgi:hypothetical protein